MTKGLHYFLKTGMLFSLLVTLLIQTACGNKGQIQGNSGTPDVVKEDPVTLKVYPTLVGLTDEDFNKLFVEPVKKRYPYISLELVRPGKGTQWEDLIVQNNIPDLLITWNGGVPQFAESLIDQTPLIKKNKIDLGRFEDVYLNAVKIVSDKGEILGLPYKANFTATYYNKNIFDKFGEAYPKDGYTWDEAIAIGKKLTRFDNGTQYRGLDADSITRLSLPYGLTFVDTKTLKASVNNEKWKSIFELQKQIYSIPGNTPPKLNAGPIDSFLKDGTIAMITTTNLFPRMKEAEQVGLNWDLAQYPNFSDLKNTSGMVDAQYIGITKTSKYPDQAMRVIETVTSDEVQLILSREAGHLTSLKNEQIKKALGKGLPFLNGKNLDAIFKSKPAPAPLMNEFRTPATTILNESFNDYFLNDKNVNTVLMEAEQKINSLVESTRKK